MIPVGYLLKRIAKKPTWLKTDQVEDLYSVSGCTSKDFSDYINFWKHNGFWLFNSPQDIYAVAKENEIDLTDTHMFYYETYELQCYEDDPTWENFKPEDSFETKVEEPKFKTLEGFDVVSFTNGNEPECSYLSCNHMAEEIKVNKHCLLETFEEAKSLLEQKKFDGCEPGPCRIMAVYSV